MSEEGARGRADEQREAHGVPAGWETLSAERRWIELPDGESGAPAPVRDLLAWVVRYGDEMRWVDLALEDRSGQVVRVERSR